jgi:hypothetical protein
MSHPLEDFAAGVMGDAPLPHGLLERAVAEEWDRATFYAFLRLSDEYMESWEYKGKTAELRRLLKEVERGGE